MLDLEKELDRLQKKEFLKEIDIYKNLLVIHYACSDINSKPIKISSVSTYDINNDESQTFSRKDQSDKGEIKLLRDFFVYLKKKLDEKYLILGFNNKGEKFGIRTIRERCLELKNDKDLIEISENLIIDFDRLIKTSFPNYFGGLNRLIEINGISSENLVKGYDELDLFEGGKFNDLDNSTKAKVHAISQLYQKFIDDDLEIFYEYINSYENKDYYQNFTRNISQIKRMIDLKDLKNQRDKEFLRKLLYINVITSMEIYLGDAFIYQIRNNERYLKKFISHHQNFEKKSYLKEVAKKYPNFESSLKYVFLEEATQILNNISFHKLENIEKLYKKVLEISFPKGFNKIIYDAILKRHNLVHRNGKDLKGKKVSIEIDSLDDLIITVKNFIGQIHNKIINLT